MDAGGLHTKRKSARQGKTGAYDVPSRQNLKEMQGTKLQHKIDSRELKHKN